MGHDVQDAIKEYWSANKPCCTPVYSEIKTCDQFMHVMKVIHFVYNQNPLDRANEDYDRSWKIRKIFSCLNSINCTPYHPKEYLTVDEVIVKFKSIVVF
jgi:hypothetical protein